MDFQSLIERKRERFQQLESEIADPRLFDNRKRASDTMREHSAIKDLLAKWEELETARRQLEDNRELATSAGRRSRADGAGRNSGAGKTRRRVGIRRPDRAPPARRKRRPRRDRGNPRRHRWQRSGHFRGRSLPDVQSLCRDGRIENRRPRIEPVGARRIERNDLQNLRRIGFSKTALRERRASRATRAGDRSARPHSHFHRDRRGPARGRRKSISN